MVSANVKIIEELKAFLESVANEPALRKLFTQSEVDFTRNRKLTLERVIGIIINMPKRSLSIELQDFFHSIDADLEPSTKGAFSLQRGKLKANFFAVWNQLLVSSFYQYYGDTLNRWRGFRILAVDGSTAYLFNKQEVVEYFGTQVNQHGSTPMAKVMQIQDILNDITTWGSIHPIKESEQAIMARLISQLPQDTITLFDRGYPSFALMYLMQNEETPRHFIMRCKVGFNKEVVKFMHSRKQSKIIEIAPTHNAISTLREHCHIITSTSKISVRAVKVKLKSGETEILLTNLYDEKLFSIEDLKYLYGIRWGIETCYSKQKNQQQMEVFSGHRVICIQQDYSAGIFVANLQSLIEKQSEKYLNELNRRRKYQYKINRNITWASLKHNIVKLFLSNNPLDILLYLQKLFERNTEPIRPGRQYPRIKKKLKTKGKFHTFTNYKRAI